MSERETNSWNSPLVADTKTVEEIAEYLQVSVETVQDWAARGVIPCTQQDTTWRFRLSEVDDWVITQLEPSPIKASLCLPELRDVLRLDRVLITQYQSKREALLGLIDVLAKSSLVRDREAVVEGIFHREKVMSTGLGIGLAVPHLRIASVTNLVMALAVNQQPILDYEVLDGTPVRIVCMILAGANQHRAYLNILAALTKKLKQQDIRRAVLEASNSAAVCRLLR